MRRSFLCSLIALGLVACPGDQSIGTATEATTANTSGSAEDPQIPTTAEVTSSSSGSVDGTTSTLNSTSAATSTGEMTEPNASTSTTSVVASTSGQTTSSETSAAPPDLPFDACGADGLGVACLGCLEAAKECEVLFDECFVLKDVCMQTLCCLQNDEPNCISQVGLRSSERFVTLIECAPQCETPCKYNP